SINHSGSITNSGTSTGLVTISGTIGGNVTGVTQNSASSTLLLNATNTYAGKTVVQSGTLSFTAGDASATADQVLGKNTDLDLGVASTSSGILNYTGGAGTLAKNIHVLGNGTDTIKNSGTGLLTLSGNLTKNGTVLTLQGGTQGITVSGVIGGSSANSDLVIAGGTTTLTNTNTYNGPTYIRNGATLNANAVGALPTANGRTAVVVDDSGSGSSKLVLGASQSAASLAGAALSTINLNSNTLTVGAASGSTNFAGVISGAGNLVKDGDSTQTLSGANSFSGTTTVSGGTLIANNATGALKDTTGVVLNTGGTLQLGAANQINNGASITLAGGTFKTGGFSESVGALTLTASSIIDMGAGSSTLTFASLAGWTAGQTLKIYNWSGTLGHSGGTDQLIFTSTAGLSSHLNQILFYSNNGTTQVGTGTMIYGNGELGPLSGVPEPSTYIGAIALLGLVGWRERRRISALLSNTVKAA
ncbi:MAG: autotransporter-associated beta strand repeat-containing protein, partial [Verrucomicrobia bacterium]|nr:autotransporter-associated beta strand repeat-containing protein [Verrucomicrobiota bacterium]